MVKSRLGVDPTQSYGEIQKSLFKILVDFPIIINWFFEIISHDYLLFSYYCLIQQYLHDFEVKKWEKNLENFSKISVFIKIDSFQDRRLYISCHEWVILRSQWDLPWQSSRKKFVFFIFFPMILYTYVIEDKQNRSKQAQHHAAPFYFFLGKFDNMKNMSVLLTTETELGQKIQ